MLDLVKSIRCVRIFSRETDRAAVEFRCILFFKFQDAIDVIKPIAKQIAGLAADLVLKYFNAEPAPVAPAAPAHSAFQVKISKGFRI